MGVERPAGAIEDEASRFGSDVVVDTLRALGYRYLPLNPGSSFRGLHDSIVNYGANHDPQLLLCLHEEIAVSLAHGYAKASRAPAAAAVHDLVGLMHASMAVYNAACDQTPLLVLGGSGPANPAARRPIDWIHSASTQGELVRQYVKWDAEASVVETFRPYIERAHAIANTGPHGPTYVSLDAHAQEQLIDTDVAACVPHPAVGVPRLHPDFEAVEQAVDVLVSADSVAVVGGRLLKDPDSTAQLVELVEALGAAYRDERNCVCFPTAHDHNCNGDRALLDDVDVVLAIGVGDLPGMLDIGVADGDKRHGARHVIEVSYGDLGVGSWSGERGLPAVSDLRIVADAELGLRAVLDGVRKRMDPVAASSRAQRVRQRSSALLEKHRARVLSRRDDSPISPSRMVAETWECVRNTNWLLLLRNTRTWPEGIWQFRGVGDFLGHSVGAGVGYGPGAMVGGALAARDSGRFPVGIVGDGDFLMAAGALWTAVHYGIPLLVVVNDNGSFYNDEEHQRAVARDRGRPEENSWIGMRLTQPRIAIGDLARAYGCWATSPISEPEGLATALAEARDRVIAGAVAVVHVLTSPT